MTPIHEGEIVERTPGEKKAYIQGFSTGWAMALQAYRTHGYDMAAEERELLLKSMVALLEEAS